MMMPANFTAVNSEVVYGGADLFSILADTTAPVWNAANVKKFNTNLITLVSNSFFADTVKSTLGVMFGGNWGGDGRQEDLRRRRRARKEHLLRDGRHYYHLF